MQCTGAAVVVYKNSKLFKGPSSNEKMAVISDVTLSGLNLTHSKENIKLSFEAMKDWEDNETQDITCVYWDGSDWSGHGCAYHADLNSCLCDHATPFTAILVGTMQQFQRISILLKSHF